MNLEALSLIPSAMAQEVAPAATGGMSGGLASFVPLVLMFAVFYLFLIRPQQKKMKEHKNMLEALRRGDKVVTAGGIFGSISKINDDGTVEVEVASGVVIKVTKPSVSEVLTRTQPANNDTPSEAKAAKKAKK